MFKDEESRKFFLYLGGTGVLLILLVCLLQAYLVPGSNGRLPIIGDLIDPPDEEEIVFEAEPDVILVEGVDYQAILHTNKGDIKMDIYEAIAPKTSNNFVFLSLAGYYDGVLFHRVINNLLIQTGSRLSMDDDATNDGIGGPGYTIIDEVNWDALDLPQDQREYLSNMGYVSLPDLASKKVEKYSVAMANGNAGNTNGSQFFIVTGESDDARLYQLQGRHTVFGEIIGGFDVVDEINSADLDMTDPNAPVPKKDIKIKSIDIIEISKNKKVVNNKETQDAIDNTVIID